MAHHRYPKLSFPNVDLTIKLKKKIEIYSIENLQILLSVIRRYELGGEYKKGEGFLIDINATHYDYDSDRPYTTLNLHSSNGVVWHSHPFGLNIENSYPSLEDIQVARENPSLIFIIFTGRGVYIISVLQRLTSEDIIEFYESMDTGDIESNFVNYEFTDEIGIFLTCIPNSKISLDLIDKTISRINKLKIDVL